MGISSFGNGHTHHNKTDLDAILIDDDSYLWLKHKTDGQDDSVQTKVKAGYADRAAANEDGYKLDWFIPTEIEGQQTLKLNPKYAALWAEGNISAGGIGQEQEGGGGLDKTAMWNSLTNTVTDAWATTKIALAHIPDLTVAKIADLSSWLTTQGYVKTSDLANTYVTVAGTQTISGSKIFSSPLTVAGILRNSASSYIGNEGNPFNSIWSNTYNGYTIGRFMKLEGTAAQDYWQDKEIPGNSSAYTYSQYSDHSASDLPGGMVAHFGGLYPGYGFMLNGVADTFRYRTIDGGTWKEWRTVVTTASLATALGDYVTLAGTQTISGAKTFTSAPTVAGLLRNSAASVIGNAGNPFAHVYATEFNGLADTARIGKALRDDEYGSSVTRATSADLSLSDGALHYLLATSSMTTGAPSFLGGILTAAWDGASYGGQLLIPNNDTQNGVQSALQWRCKNAGTWGEWHTVASKDDVPDYALTTNYFAPASLTGKQTNFLHNTLYAADKRFSITISNNWKNWSGTGTRAAITDIFSSDYNANGNTMGLVAGTTGTITIDFTNNSSYGIVYPEGVMYLTFYSNNPASVTASLVFGQTASSTTTRTVAFARVSPTKDVWTGTIPSTNYLRSITFTVMAQSDKKADLIQIDWSRPRWDSINEVPVVLKARPNTLYGALTIASTLSVSGDTTLAALTTTGLISAGGSIVPTTATGWLGNVNNFWQNAYIKTIFLAAGKYLVYDSSTDTVHLYGAASLVVHGNIAAIA